MPEASIRVEDLAFTYPDAKRAAIQNVSFIVERGEIFGFLGPSGAGKSTTQNILIHLLDGYAGTVIVLDRDLRAWNAEYYRHIGVAFEAPNHYLKLSARENLELLAGLYGQSTQDVMALLDRVGLAADADKRVGEFSKGMGGYLMSAPGMIGFVIGFLLLDERDTGTLKALRVTPLPMRDYLAYRVTGPLVVGTVATVIGYPLAGLSPVGTAPLVAIAVVASLAAPLLALVLATAAPNKVAGFAVVKVLNGVNLLPIAAFFIPEPAQYIGGVVPTYWPMRALWSAAGHQPYAGFLAIGAMVGMAAVLVAVRLFNRRLAAT